MSGSFAQKDNVLFEQQSLDQYITAVVPDCLRRSGSLP